jgi:hypothetical protein
MLKRVRSWLFTSTDPSGPKLLEQRLSLFQGELPARREPTKPADLKGQKKLRCHRKSPMDEDCLLTAARSLALNPVCAWARRPRARLAVVERKRAS